MRFKNRVIVVTGGATGIGNAAAMLFAEEGAIVAVNDLSEDSTERAVELIRSAGGNAIPIPGDVADEDRVVDLARGLVDRYGRIDVLVNAAAQMKLQPAETYQNWQRLMSVNVDGSFYWARAAAVHSMIQRRRGSIVNISSGAGLAAVPGDIGYTTSKHAVIGLTRGLSVEWAPFGIRVNCVCPGLTETPMFREMEHADPQRYAARRARIPLGRPARAREQANAIAFLASDDASYATGLIMNVDGGQMALFSGNSPRAVE